LRHDGIAFVLRVLFAEKLKELLGNERDRELLACYSAQLHRN
jgi:hypothetical protein